MLLRRPLSALLRPLLASSAFASPASPLRLSGAAAATATLRRRPGLFLPRSAPFCTSGNITPASNALACLDPLEVLRLRLEKERGICIDRLVPGVQHSGVCPEVLDCPSEFGPSEDHPIYTRNGRSTNRWCVWTDAKWPWS